MCEAFSPQPRQVTGIAEILNSFESRVTKIISTRGIIVPNHALHFNLSNSKFFFPNTIIILWPYWNINHYQSYSTLLTKLTYLVKIIVIISNIACVHAGIMIYDTVAGHA